MKSLVLVFCLMLSCATVLADSLVFKSDPLMKIANKNASEDSIRKLPLSFNHPADYVVDLEYFPQLMTVFLRSAKSDVVAFVKGDYPDGVGDGLFTVRASRDQSYDTATKMFLEEKSSAMSNYARKAGFKNFMARRADALGIPVLEVSYDMPNGMHFSTCYLPAGIADYAYQITYFHPEPYGERDALIWRTFVDGLGKKDGAGKP